MAKMEENRFLAKVGMMRSAFKGHDYAQVLLDRMEEMKPPSVLLSSTRLFHHMSRIFQDNSLPKKSPKRARTRSTSCLATSFIPMPRRIR